MTYFNRDDNRQDSRKSFGPKRDFGGRGGQGQDRKMYPAVCDSCGRECQLPFFPDGSKPVYCSNCFEKNQGGFEQKRSGFGERRFEERRSAPSQSQNQNNDLLVSINNKLGKILEILNANNKLAEKKVETKPVEKAKKAEKKKKKGDTILTQTDSELKKE
jgi:CxxC-x17-CxxC domain-containing protein